MEGEEKQVWRENNRNTHACCLYLGGDNHAGATLVLEMTPSKHLGESAGISASLQMSAGRQLRHGPIRAHLTRACIPLSKHNQPGYRQQKC